MTKWKIFNRFKGKIQKESDRTTIQENKIEDQSLETKTRKEPEKISTKVYDETLYSQGSRQKQPAPSSEKKHLIKRTSWENTETIECNIDNMRRKRQKLAKSKTDIEDDINNKVDFLFLKKKKPF